MKDKYKYFMIPLVVWNCNDNKSLSKDSREVLLGGEEAFIEACENGDYDAVKSILDTNDISEESINIALINAAYKGNLNILELLLGQPNVNINYEDYRGCSVLYFAVWHNFIDIVKYLVDHPNIDVHEINKVLESAKKWERKEIVMLLEGIKEVKVAALDIYGNYDDELAGDAFKKKNDYEKEKKRGEFC